MCACKVEWTHREEPGLTVDQRAPSRGPSIEMVGPVGAPVYPTRQRKPAKSVVCLPIDSSTSDPQGCANPTVSIVLRRLRLIEEMDAFHRPAAPSPLPPVPRPLPFCRRLPRRNQSLLLVDDLRKMFGRILEERYPGNDTSG